MNLLKTFAGLFIMLCGLVYISSNILTGLLLLAIACFIIPAIHKQINAKLKEPMTRRFKTQMIICCLMGLGATGVIYKFQKENRQEQKDKQAEQDLFDKLPQHAKDSILTARRKLAKENAAHEAAERHYEMITDKFSPIDGENRGLANYIKSKLHDPDSYEHVKTKWIDREGHIVVHTTIRARNRFGAKTLSTYEAIITYDDNLVSLKEVN